MAWLRKAAGSALRGAGNVLAVHVVPDNITPWKIRKHLASATRAASKAGYSAGKKKKNSPARKSSPRTASPMGRRPASSRPAFNKNAWGRGASLAAAPGFSSPHSTSRPAAGAHPSFSDMVRKRGQQLRDFRKEPRLVIQMHLDELLHSAKAYKLPTRKQKYPN